MRGYHVFELKGGTRDSVRKKTLCVSTPAEKATQGNCSAEITGRKKENRGLKQKLGLLSKDSGNLP